MNKTFKQWEDVLMIEKTIPFLIRQDWKEEREILIKIIECAIENLKGAEDFYGGGTYDSEIAEYKSILYKIGNPSQ